MTKWFSLFRYIGIDVNMSLRSPKFFSGRPHAAAAYPPQKWELYAMVLQSVCLFVRLSVVAWPSSASGRSAAGPCRPRVSQMSHLREKLHRRAIYAIAAGPVVVSSINAAPQLLVVVILFYFVWLIMPSWLTCSSQTLVTRTWFFSSCRENIVNISTNTFKQPIQLLF